MEKRFQPVLGFFCASNFKFISSSPENYDSFRSKLPEIVKDNPYVLINDIITADDKLNINCDSFFELLGLLYKMFVLNIHRELRDNPNSSSIVLELLSLSRSIRLLIICCCKKNIKDKSLNEIVQAFSVVLIQVNGIKSLIDSALVSSDIPEERIETLFSKHLPKIAKLKDYLINNFPSYNKLNTEIETDYKFFFPEKYRNLFYDREYEELKTAERLKIETVENKVDIPPPTVEKITDKEIEIETEPKEKVEDKVGIFPPTARKKSEEEIKIERDEKKG
jgi:hypothetical protein